LKRTTLVLLASLGLLACRAAGTSGIVTPLKKIRYVWRPAVSNAALLLAIEEGYFRKRGLDIELVELTRNQDALPSLIDGKIDVVSGAISPGYLNAIARGADVRLVAEHGRLDPEGCTYAALVARKGLLRQGKLGPPQGRDAWRIDLRSGSMSEFLLERALSSEGIPPQRVKIDFVPANAELQALQNGAIDVTLGLGNRLQEDLREGQGEVWRSGESLAPGFSFLATVYGPRLLRQDPEAGQALMAGFLEGVRQYRLGKTERNVEIVARRLGLDRDAVRDACWITIEPDAHINVAGMLEFQAWAVGKGLQDRALRADEFWDPRFSAAAVRSLASPEPSQ
jgi:NitT/TauT family transport system substrate-binding protein